MRPALKRRNSPANEAGDDVLWRQASIAQVILNPVESIHRSYHVLGVVSPILHLIGGRLMYSRRLSRLMSVVFFT
jgi:hypothetical protein